MKNQAESLERLLRIHNQSRKYSKNIFAFASGKGGTGKTFLATNLAYNISINGAKVLFIDFDSNLSNADVLLNINPTSSMIDYLRGEKKIRNCITKVQDNFFGIFGESGTEKFPQVTTNSIDRFIEEIDWLADEFDFIFIDTGAGINKEIIHLLSNVSNIVLVINPEPTTIMDAYAVLKLIHPNDNRKFIIVNSAYSKEEGEAAYENIYKAVNHFLKIKVESLGQISFSTEIRQSIIEQKILCKFNASSNSAKQIAQISQKLLEMNQLANIRHFVI